MLRLKKSDRKKNWKIRGEGGSTTDPLEWKFQGGGGGGLKLNNHPWGDMDIFWKHTLYIFGKSALSWPGGKVRAGTFANNSNFVSWQSEMRLASLHDFYGS